LGSEGAGNAKQPVPLHLTLPLHTTSAYERPRAGAMQSVGAWSDAVLGRPRCPAHLRHPLRSARLSQRGSLIALATTAPHQEESCTAASMSQGPSMHGGLDMGQRRVSIRHADSSSLYWCAADIHCRVFHEEKASHGPADAAAALAKSTAAAGLMSELPQRIAVAKALLDRVDRVACLQSLADHAITGAGK
jgi:hypothetical protein